MDGTRPEEKTKLVVFEVAFKNASPTDRFLNSEGLFTLVDDKQGTYSLNGIALESGANKGFAPTLKPGQGVGQAFLHDPLRIAFRIPSEVVATELLVNSGRLYTKEKVLRYLISPPSTPPKSGRMSWPALPAYDA